MKRAAPPSILFTVILLGFAVIAGAQQPKNAPRIGYLSRDLHPADSRASASRYVEGFRQGLRELGYIEGKNINIEYRYADGRFERLPALAEELVRLKVDIIVTDLSLSARAAKKATSTIPIVVASGSDPIQSGLVASLARPGGNVTGLTSYTSELLGKRLELLKEWFPQPPALRSVNDVDGVASRSVFEDEGKVAAETLGFKLQLIEVKAPNPDLDGAFRVMVKERIGALVTAPAPLLGIILHRRRILELLKQHRIPAIHPSPPWIDDGGLMYYGTNNADLHRRAATYVDKILRGSKPADLPIERPTKFELVINLKTAKQIGLTIPPNVLVRADRVIK